MGLSSASWGLPSQAKSLGIRNGYHVPHHEKVLPTWGRCLQFWSPAELSLHGSLMLWSAYRATQRPGPLSPPDRQHLCTHLLWPESCRRTAAGLGHSGECWPIESVLFCLSTWHLSTQRSFTLGNRLAWTHYWLLSKTKYSTWQHKCDSIEVHTVSIRGKGSANGALPVISWSGWLSSYHSCSWK